MLLSLAAILSKTTEEIIHNALDVVPTKLIYEWAKENIGNSVQSKRKKVLEVIRKMEQKKDDILIPYRA